MMDDKQKRDLNVRAFHKVKKGMLEESKKHKNVTLSHMEVVALFSLFDDVVEAETNKD